MLLRVYLYGVLLLVLAGGASFVVGRFVLTPAVEVPARPSTAWIAWHFLEHADDRQQLARELGDLKRRARVEMTLFDADGQLIASSADRPATALRPAELAALARHGTRFGPGEGSVATVELPFHVRPLEPVA